MFSDMLTIKPCTKLGREGSYEDGVLYGGVKDEVVKEQLKDLGTMEAVRRKCLDCSGGNPNDVRNCDCDCALKEFRMETVDGKVAGDRRLKAIKKACLECMGEHEDSPDYVMECGYADSSWDCPLWKFRFGKNPNRFGKMSEETREKKRQFMKALRQKQLEAMREAKKNALLP